MKKKFIISNKIKFSLFIIFLIAIISVPIKNITESFFSETFVEEDNIVEFNNENITEEPEVVEIVVEIEEPIEVIEPKIDYLADTSYVDENGTTWVTNFDDIHILVNKERNLPKNHKPKDLVIPNVQFTPSENMEKRHLREEPARALELMFEAAKAEGLNIIAVSGYRSYGFQEILFNQKVNNVGLEEANKLVAVPGQSEHQTGLAIDLSTVGLDYELLQDFGNTPEGIWMKNNGHKFGFILRFPEDKTHITGYSYEPWHFRYLGVDLATEVYESGLSLEEFFQN